MIGQDGSSSFTRRWVDPGMISSTRRSRDEASRYLLLSASETTPNTKAPVAYVRPGSVTRTGN